MRQEELDNIREKINNMREVPEEFNFDKEAVWLRVKAKLQSSHIDKKEGKSVGVFIGLTFFIIFLFEFLLFYLLTTSLVISERQIGTSFQPPELEQLVRVKVDTQTATKVKDFKWRDKDKENQLSLAQENAINDSTQDISFLLPKTQSSFLDTITPANSIPNRGVTEFHIIYYNELPEQQGPIIIPGQGKTRVGQLFKSKSPVMVYENSEQPNKPKRIKYEN